MSDYYCASTHQRSQEWLSLIDAANEWQQAYDLLMYWEGRQHSEADARKAALALAVEQAAYDAWNHALVAFQRHENRKRVAQ